MTTVVEGPPVRLSMTEEEAATYLAAKTGLKFSKHMVQKRRQDGRLAGRLMDGRRVVYLKADLDAYLTKNLGPPGAEDSASAGREGDVREPVTAG